jgi:hypothetical protein
VHGLDQNQPGQTLVCDFNARQAARNDSDDFASVIKSGIGQRSHQACVRSTINQPQTGLTQ